MKKIKIFLGGYPNFINAQNINCHALSQHLDKNKFEVTTMLDPKSWANATDFKKVPGVHYIQLYRPMRLLSKMGYILGIPFADIAYLPKGSCPKLTKWLCKTFKTKMFNTIEGLISDTDLSKIPENRREEYLENLHIAEPHLYAITQHIYDYVGRTRNCKFAKPILYLGVEADNWLNPDKQVNGLKNVVFIGNKLPTKNIFDFFDAARANPDINFHVVGDNILNDTTIDQYLIDEKLSNVTYHGRLTHTEMSACLKTMDLMYFPSRSEGFPKVHLETACAGVPTLCYRDYGADEWITTGKDGFVVDTKEEALAVIADLKAHPEKLADLSRNAVEMGKKFDWKERVKVWEEVIERIYLEHR